MANGHGRHWRGLVIVTQALRDAAWKSFMAANVCTADSQTAVQEDVDVVGLSIMTAT